MLLDGQDQTPAQEGSIRLSRHGGDEHTPSPAHPPVRWQSLGNFGSDAMDSAHSLEQRGPISPATPGGPAC